MIPKEYVQTLIEQADIVAIIGAEIPLEKGGKNHFGICPFHKPVKDKSSATFSVAPAKRFYHCFSCGAHGSVIGFFMEYKGLPFPDAVALVAARAGVAPPVETGRERNVLKNAAALKAMDHMELALAHYREALKRSPEAIAIMKAHGVSGRTAARFRVGYAADGWRNLESVFGADYEETVVGCGLGVESDKRVYDRFRDRIMFPVLNARGRVSAFYGLAAGPDRHQQRFPYLRSARHAASLTGGETFGLEQARTAIAREGYAVVVGNCMDVLVLNEAGMDNAVCVPGELRHRVKPEHLASLFRVSPVLVLCFPATDAGLNAMWQTTLEALSLIDERKQIRFAMLPDGCTPADMAAAPEGAEEFILLVRSAVPLSEYLAQTLGARHDVHTVEGRAALLAEGLALADRVPSAHLRRQLSERIEMLTQEDIETLESVSEHDEWLEAQLREAREEVVIVSPWITQQGVSRAGLCRGIAGATGRGVAVRIFTDAEFNQARRTAPHGDLYSDGAHRALTDAGAQVHFVRRVHSKLVVKDSDALCIGSFNWLSAARGGRHRRHEVSIVQRRGAIAERKAAMLSGLAARLTDYDPPDEVR